MRRKFPIAMIFVLLLCWGCATYTPPDLSNLVWPPPPDKARVRLLKVIYTDADVKEGGTTDILFGRTASFAFKKPFRVAADGKGNIYVSDTYQGAIFILNLEEGSIDRLPNPRGLGSPGGIAVDNENKLLAANYQSRVFLFDLETREETLAVGKSGEFSKPSGIAFDPQRKFLYIADIKKSELYKYDYDGNFIEKVAEPGSEPGQVFMPSGIATDREGTLYVVDQMNFRVQIFNPDGSLQGTFGEHGVAPGMFARPKDITVSRDGILLVTDAAFNNFQILDKRGRPYLFVGIGGKGYGSFRIPQGIFVDDDDKIYVVDSVNRRLQIFQLLTDRYYAEHPEGEEKDKEAAQ